MELGTTFIGVLVLLVCIIPFALVSINNKLSNKKKLQELNNFANKNNSNITIHELWRNSSIGIDEAKNELYFITDSSETKVYQRICLLGIDNCSIKNISNTLSNKGNSYRLIESLDLILTYKDKNEAKSVLSIYNNSSLDVSIADELKLAERWKNIINEKIKSI